ncbi:biliverdin-producing heme oxygenase [Massilia sp. TWP1-3-3]|uniref:biliverdin-producing heme oxygenase n=1 Tax=Massilia sp. TWP1-3-3 TaxID=2804573 RepID=UPI003CEC6E3F
MGTTLQTPLLSRLRSETRTEHDAVERTLRLMEDDLTLERYRRRLEQFYGFYQPIEKWLLDDGGFIAPWLAVEPRRKTPLLQADLIALGQQTDTRLPLCTQLPSLGSAAECFGCLYVLEGATLGGVIINRYVEQKLGVAQDSGAKFFCGYGGQTGAMWQQFRTAISDFSLTSSEQDVVVASARATFDTLQQWCEKEVSR